VKQEMAANSIG